MKLIILISKYYKKFCPKSIRILTKSRSLILTPPSKLIANRIEQSIDSGQNKVSVAKVLNSMDRNNFGQILLHGVFGGIDVSSIWNINVACGV